MLIHDRDLVELREEARMAGGLDHALAAQRVLILCVETQQLRDAVDVLIAHAGHGTSCPTCEKAKGIRAGKITNQSEEEK